MQSEIAPSAIIFWHRLQEKSIHLRDDSCVESRQRRSMPVIQTVINFPFRSASRNAA
jgi:hypothetical protein